MTNCNDFNQIVKSEFYVINEEEKMMEIVQLYEYTHTVNMNKQEESGYHNSLSTILTTKLILEETKRISRRCVEEKLEEYSEDDFAFEEIEKIIGEEVKGRN